MKLAEALSLRATCQKKVLHLTDRLKANALVQEGDAPSEDPNQLLAEFNDAAEEFQRLVTQINRTNIQVRLQSGVTMTEALARRDTLHYHISMWRQLADAASQRQIRGLKTEIRFVPVVNVSDARDKVNQFSKELRELDVSIQEANWINELVE